MHIARPASSPLAAPEDRAREILLSGRSRLAPRLRIAAAHAAWAPLRPGEWATRIAGSPARVVLSPVGVCVEVFGARALVEPAPAAWARPIPARVA